MKNHRAGPAGVQFAHDRLESPDAVQHHGHLPFVRQRELRPERRQLYRTVGAAHEIESRFADRLHLAEQRHDRANVFFVSIPRMNSGCPRFDAAAGRAVGVYVDESIGHRDKCTNFK